MADIQHQDARKLLSIISSATYHKTKLTYIEAARIMGREPAHNHSRAIAQMCDLLDAAACLAGVPLLALVAVREKSGDVNQRAWKREYGLHREAIINRSTTHRFSPADYEAISNAIDDLGERGNRKAWQYVHRLYPGALLFRRLIGDYTDLEMNAIDDIGTDTPDRTSSEVYTYARDPKVREAVLQRAEGKCEFCGEPGFIKANGDHYLESHHIIALAYDGEDRLTNVIALCPNDHREAHFGRRAKEIEVEMQKKLRIITSTKQPVRS